MNPDSDLPSRPSAGEDDARDVLADALLAEHARLGSADDEILLATVRARTVEMPGPMEPVILSEARFGLQDWMKVAAVVVASLGLLWLVLQTNSGDPVVRVERPEHTMRLVIIPQNGAETMASAAAGKRDPKSSTTAAEVPGGMSFEDFDLGEMSLSTELLAEFSVSADRMLRSDQDHVVYEGGVVLKHPDFTIQADRLELASSERDGEEQLVGGFVALGDEIRIDRYSVAGSLERASAQEVTYQPEGGALILRGAPSLSSGSGNVVPKSAGGMIVLLQDGFQVIEPGGERR